MLRKMNSFRKGIAFICLLVLCAAAFSACAGKPDEQTEAVSEPSDTESGSSDVESGSEDPDETNSTGTKTLREFCADKEVDAWFDGLDQNKPVKLEYWVYGEAPYSMEFTDEELITETARALQSVEIGGVSEENPDWVDDAGGGGYYFTMEDGSTIGFAFMMGCFKWNGSEYHDVASFGTLPKVSEKLEEIGNPQPVPVYAGDSGFYTEALATYETDWAEEDGVIGGLFIYPEEKGVPPFIEISRCIDETPDDPEGYLTDYLIKNLREEIEGTMEGAEFRENGKVREYEYGGRTFVGMPCSIISEDGETLTMQVLVLKTQDTLLDEDHLVRFYAMYDETDEEQAKKMEDALYLAAKEFNLKNMWYEEGEVQPGSLLLDFCNDPALNAWFEKAEKETPDDVTLITESWHMAEDPELVHAVLEALKTVRIGEESDEIIGASGRQIYDFSYHDTGNYQSFEFFEDTFFYDMANYKVLDWGDLEQYVEILEQY